MEIRNNTLYKIDPVDVIDGIFTAPVGVFYIGDDLHCDGVVKMVLPNVKEIGDSFLYYDKNIKYLEMPKVERIGRGFLFFNKYIEHLEIPKAEVIGDSFLYFNIKLEILNIPNIRKIGNYFLCNNNILESIYMPNINEIHAKFLYRNDKFQYTPGIIKALKDHMYIGGEMVDKTEYLRKINLKKILC